MSRFITQTKADRIRQIRSDPDSIHIEDCWHAGQELKDRELVTFSEQVIETWHLAHDLRDEYSELKLEHERLLEKVAESEAA